MNTVLRFLLSLSITIVASLLFIRMSATWGFIDLPDPRKVHTIPTPRTGGLAILVGCALGLWIATLLKWMPWPIIPWQTSMAGLGFTTIGALDDRFSFHPRQKVLILLALSALAAWPWVLHIKVVGVSWLPQVLTNSTLFVCVASIILVLWFMAVPNAVNIQDAINGYMGGYLFIVMAAVYARGLDTSIALGSLVGFLSFNWPRARHFMGDAGSFGFGFLLAEILLRCDGLDNPIMPLVFTAPISFDVAMGLIRRRALRMSFFDADCRTFPHQILRSFHGRTELAAPFLWLNATVLILLSTTTIGLILYLLFFTGLLLYFNIPYIFERTAKLSK